MNWWDSSVEKLIQKFSFQFHLVRKTGTRKLVPVSGTSFRYRFLVRVSLALDFQIETRLSTTDCASHTSSNTDRIQRCYRGSGPTDQTATAQNISTRLHVGFSAEGGYQCESCTIGTT